jgi:arginine deiminase
MPSRALIVEDDLRHQELLARFLKEHLWRVARDAYPDLLGEDDPAVDSVRFADEAVDLVQGHDDYMAVFLDLVLPKSRMENKPTPESGEDVLKSLADKQYPVLIVSGYEAETMDALRARRPLFCSYRSKAAILELMQKLDSDDVARQSLDLEAHGILAFILASHPTYNTALRIEQRQKTGGHSASLMTSAGTIAAHVYKRNALRDLGDPSRPPDSGTAVMEGAVVKDEIAPLRGAIVHSPGPELRDILTHECPLFLVDQPLHYRTIREQHGVFKNVLRETNSNPIELTDLLAEVLGSSPDLLRDFAWEVTRMDNLPPNIFFDLISRPRVEDVIRYAIEGVRSENGDWLLRPTPNLVFTRDIGFRVHDRVFSFLTRQPIRRKEKLVVDYVLKHHPAFKGCVVELDPSTAGAKNHEESTIEGGDVVLLNEKTVMIGISERTSLPAVEMVAKKIMETTPVERVVATEAPLQYVRSMHLDTYLGVVDKDLLLVYKEPFKTREQVFYEYVRGNARAKLRQAMLKDYVKEDGLGFEIVWVDDQHEHWEDGCNVLALAPACIVVYRRASQTIERFKELGWVEVPAEDFGTGRNPKPKLRDEKYLITLDGYELALARGGPHCMTFPIARDYARP